MCYVRILILLLIIIQLPSGLHAQKPKDGTYTYSISFAEWQGKTLNATCTVVINGDKIKVIHNGSKLSGLKGDLIDEGIIMKHKSGKWIIANDKKDRYIKEIGGCSDGPRVIDFKNKRLWLC